MDERRSKAWVRKEIACPLCGSEAITTSQRHQAVNYGSGKSAAELTVNVPVRRCETCEFEFLDEEAERLKHEAICKHLGVLSPDEIRHIRGVHRMTRTRFAELTGLGEASLNRWENGLSIQTQANDRYLRLLGHPEIIRHLEDIVASISSSPSLSLSMKKRFRVLEVTGAKRKEGERFQLRKAA